MGRIRRKRREQGRIDEAVEAYRKALAIQPGHRQADRALKELLRSAPR